MYYFSFSKKLILILLCFLIFSNVSNGVSEAIGNSTERGIKYASVVKIDQNEIVGNTNSKISGSLEITIDASTYSSFNVSLSQVDLKLLNEENTNMITSIWFEYGKDFGNLTSNYPFYNITIPFKFNPRLLDSDTNIVFDVKIKGIYECFDSKKEYFVFQGTLSSMNFNSNIKYVADMKMDDPDIYMDTTTKLMIVIALLIIILIIRSIYRYISKKVNTQKKINLIVEDIT